jgi:hypothetical protein
MKSEASYITQDYLSIGLTINKEKKTVYHYLSKIKFHFFW